MADSFLLQAILNFNAGAAIRDMGRAAVAFERLRSNANAVKIGAQQLGSGMGKLALGFAPMALGMGFAVNKAREFEKGIAMIQTIADPAEFSTRKLEDATLALSMAYGTAPTAQAEAMYQAISSGATTAAQANAIMDTSNKLAVAGGAELGGTLKLLGTIMNTYGEQGLSASSASDILFQSTNYGIMTIAELGASMGDVVPTAASLGIGFGELNAAMATATLRGATASEAAVGLNMALVNVIKPTKDASDIAKTLGLEFNATALRTKGLSGFLADIVKKTGGSEEALTGLFGSVMGFKVAMKLAGDQGQLFNEIVGKINGTTDAMRKQLETAVPSAVALGIGTSELAASIGTITSRGMSASSATRGFNSALASVAKPTEAATIAANKLGLQFGATALKEKGLIGFMVEAVQKAGGNTDAMLDLFGSVSAVKAVMELTQGQGQLFNQNLNDLAGSADATDKAFARMAGTLDFQMRQMKASSDVAQVLLGQVLEGGLLRLMAPLAGVTQSIVNVLQAVKTGEMTGLSEGEIAVANGVRDAIDEIGASISWLIKQFTEAKKWMTDTFGGDAISSVAKWGVVFAVAAVAIVPIGAALAGIGFIIPALTTALVGLGGILSGAFGLALGPIGLVVGAIVLFRDEFYSVFRGIMEVVGPVFDDLKSVFMATFGEVSQAIGAIVSAFKGGADTIGVDWKEVGRVIGSVLGVTLVTVAKFVGGTVVLVARLAKGFVDLGKMIGETVGAAFLFVMRGAAKFAGGLATVMRAMGLTAPKGLIEFSKQKFEQPRARSASDTYVNEVVRTEREVTKSKATKEVEGRGALATVLDEIREASKNSAAAAKSAEEAAKKKPAPTQVNINGREVARANSKAEEDVRVRSGDALTPWQRNQIVVHGARPV